MEAVIWFGETKTSSLSGINQLVEKQRYPVVEKNRFDARCIDGRYAGQSLPPLARPGADAGAIMELIALNRGLNLNLTNQEIVDIFLSIIGGWSRFHFHTDTHHQNNIFGCGHIKQATDDPSAYGLEKKDLEFLEDFLSQALQKGARREILEGKHDEGAVVVLKGTRWSLSPAGKAFVYHADLDAMRRVEIVRVILSYDDKIASAIDQKKLYDELTQIADRQRSETVKRLAPNLPIYEISFSSGDEYKIKPISPVD